MFVPTLREEAGPPVESAPFFDRYWYFAHHVGCLGLSVWANTAVAENRTAATIDRQLMTRVKMHPPVSILLETRLAP